MTKTWGPFSGRQLTTIIGMLLVAVVVLPSAVWAVDTFSNVAIEDPITNDKAGVDSSNRLKVGDGSGALTVDGTVTGRPAPPSSPWARFTTLGTTLQAGMAGPTASAIDITNATISVSSLSSPGTVVRSVAFWAVTVPGTATYCTPYESSGLVYRVDNIHEAAAVVLTFPTPLQLRPASGKKVCLGVSASDSFASLSVSGYFGT